MIFSAPVAPSVRRVDSTANTLDERVALLYFAPRKRGSAWARTNKERIERLEREG